MISKDKQEALRQRMEKLGIYEDDLIEKFVLGSGKGGQKVNKTFSCVYLKHLPTKLEVKCQQERSRELNRYIARRMLCEKLEEQLQVAKTKRQKEIDKIRKQKKRRTRRVQKKVMGDKMRRSKVKKHRQNPSEE